MGLVGAAHGQGHRDRDFPLHRADRDRQAQVAGSGIDRPCGGVRGGGDGLLHPQGLAEGGGRNRLPGKNQRTGEQETELDPFGQVHSKAS